MYEPQLEAEALSEACGVPPLRLDHAARFGQPLLVLVSFHESQQVDVAGELDQIRMGGDQEPVLDDDDQPGHSLLFRLDHDEALVSFRIFWS